MEPIKAAFHAVDFVIFSGVFLISIFVGAIFAYKDRKNQSAENYYFGDRKLSPVPIAISISVSYVSAITVMGIPAEVYLYGVVFAWYLLVLIIGNTVAVVYYIPLFHRLRLCSVYEYLELRYHRVVRKLASFLGVINMLMYLAIAVYTPSLALSAVTSMGLKWTIALTSITCTLYTALGGMKAVIWTDVFQSLIMTGGMIAVFAQTVGAVGGFESVFDAAQRGGRDNFFKFNADPRIRSTAWTIVVGYGLSATGSVVCAQIFVQRWLSCRTIESARGSVIISTVPLIIFFAVSIGNGLASYAYYEGCDPLMSKKISKIDQLIPRLAVDIFQSMPGMAGLFVSAGFCGTLSTVSSGINALAAIGLIDYALSYLPNLNARIKVMASKILTLFSGLIVMILAYVIALAPANILQVGVSVSGLVVGPTLGIFSMGLFMPWINYKGAVAGLVSGVALSTWIGLAAMFGPVVYRGAAKLVTSVDSCAGETGRNFTSFAIDITTSNYPVANETYTLAALENNDSYGLYSTLYAISPYYYGVIGFLTSLVGAHVVSFFTGFNKPSLANPNLFVPIIDNKVFPERMRKFFRFGVPELLRSDGSLGGVASYRKGKHEAY